MDSPAIFNFELGATQAESDQIVIQQSSNLMGVINLTFLDGFSGGTFDLFDFGFTYDISGLSPGELPEGYTGQLVMDENTGRLGVTGLPPFKGEAGVVGATRKRIPGLSSRTSFLKML